LEVKCSICGKKQEITKIHKDYQKLARNPKENFICWECENRLKYQASKKHEPQRPI
jgi:uncharacterized protein YlaI